MPTELALPSGRRDPVCWVRSFGQPSYWKLSLLSVPFCLVSTLERRAISPFYRCKWNWPGTWEPLLRCHHACTWTRLFLSNEIEKPSGTKNNGVHAQLGQILDPKDTRRLKNTTATFEEPGAKSRRLGVKAGYCSFCLPTAPPKGWAKLLNHPSGPAPGHTPYKQQTQKGACCSRSPSGTTRAPLNPCLNFLSSL